MTQSSFTILELISQSPTTSVYKAHQNVLDRTVLLKVLHKHLLRDRDLVARFSREAKACAILKSENIVQVHDLTEVDGAPAIVMEYVDGKSLAELLEDESNRSEELLLKVARAVLRALAYAHESGVTHRDIKPGNILISEGGVIKVTDFGLAAVSDAPSLTMEGSLIGTPAYMSPEQARGEVVDNRTDIFSLGVTLVEVLTGDKILAGRSYAECINKIQSFDVGSLEYLRPRCSAFTFDLLARMLRPDKDARFASAREALDFLESQEKSEASSTRGRRRRSNRGWLVAGFALAILLVTGLSIMLRHSPTVEPRVSSDSTSQAKAEGPSSLKSLVTAGDKVRPENVEPSKRKDTEEDGDVRKKGDSPAKTVQTPTSISVGAVESDDSGYVSIRCTPWAKIYIDSEYAGTTPIPGSLRIPVGEHTVTFNNPNFAPIVRTVNIQTNSLTSVETNFLSNSGYLLVSVDPWGDVYVDDQFRETTPSVQPIVVSAGLRRIRVHNPNFQDIVRTVSIPAGDTTRISFSFLTQGNK